MAKIDYDKEYTRDEVIALVGLAAVLEAEADNCDYTNRVMANSDLTEFAGYSDYTAAGDRVVAYYYQPSDVLREMAEAGDNDLGGLNWKIDHYKIV